MKEADIKPTIALERLRAASAEMEESIKEEGFDEHGPIGVFVRTLRAAIEELGSIVAFAKQEISVKVGGLCEGVENSTKTLEGVRLVQLEGLFKGAEQVLVMARESVTAAMMVKERIAEELIPKRREDPRVTANIANADSLKALDSIGRIEKSRENEAITIVEGQPLWSFVSSRLVKLFWSR